MTFHAFNVVHVQKASEIVKVQIIFYRFTKYINLKKITHV